MNNSFYLINIPEISDDRGQMCVIECCKDIPFVIKRAFYDYNNIDCCLRGNHANKNSRFVFICLSGSCCIDVDDGKISNSFLLDSPTKALFINKMVWKVMKDFSPDCVLLVLSDCHYDKNEYIKDFETFLIEKRK